MNGVRTYDRKTFQFEFPMLSARPSPAPPPVRDLLVLPSVGGGGDRRGVPAAAGGHHAQRQEALRQDEAPKVQG